jgi:hypothetical protein
MKYDYMLHIKVLLRSIYKNGHSYKVLKILEFYGYDHKHKVFGSLTHIKYNTDNSMENMNLSKTMTAGQAGKANSHFIFRKIKVNRSRSPQEALKATGRVGCLNDEVVREMPKSEGEEVTIYFILFNRQISVNELEKEVDKLGYKLVDPISLTALNEAEPEFADNYPNCTQWCNKHGEMCYVKFYRIWGTGVRCVDVNQHRHVWNKCWLVGCFCKHDA